MKAVLVSLICLPMLACTTNPDTGRAEIDGTRAAAVIGLGFELLAAVADDGGDGAGAVAVRAAETIEEGIDRFCALSDAGKATARDELDRAHPGIRAVAIATYGGPDGDVCTDDGDAGLPLPDE